METTSQSQVRTFAPLSWRFSESLSIFAYYLFVAALLLFSRFDVYDLAIVLYLELLVIGAHALLRLLTATVTNDLYSTDRVHVSFAARFVLSLILAIVFISKYGALMLGFGITILLLPDEIGMSATRLTTVHPLVTWCLWIMLLRYGAMLVWNTFLQADYRGESVIRLLLYPYLHALWIAAAFAVGFVLAALAGSNEQYYFAAGAIATRLIPELTGVLLRGNKQTAASAL